jgi:phospholipase/lecithinase/hemolysin
MTFPAAFLRPLLRSAAAVAAATLLASCGGGDPVERFVPERVIVFGDESVALVDSGDHNAAKTTVNALDTGNTRVCGNHPLWTQVLAGAWGFVFGECNPNNATPRALSYASVTDNNAADVQAQINTFIAGAAGPFGPKDLVAVNAGTQDIVDAFALPADQRDAAIRAAATSLGLQINRVVDQGAKVAFTSVPNVGFTPWGRDAARTTELTRLTRLFNDTLRSTVVNDGRKVALVDAYESVRQVVLNPALQGFVNVTDPLCTPANLTTPDAPRTDCTTNTLATGGTVSTWLWADNLRLSPSAQSRIGVLAADRVRNHPF